MNLYLYPEGANNNNGYGFAVERDYQNNVHLKDDIIIWYTILNKKDLWHLKDTDFIIKKNSFISIKSIYNILKGKERTELLEDELSFIKKQKFDKIFCGDTIFYNSIRNKFPNTPIIVRFHNCFSRIYDRQKLLRLPIGWKFSLKLKNMYNLERRIFNDSKVHKIFISKEDQDYYTSMTGKYNDSETWSMNVDYELMNNKRRDINYTNKIIWYGGVESHKESSVIWFIKNVYPIIKNEIPDIEFHLWGRSTEKFDDKKKGIYGHGFYQSKNFPDYNSLYINPDLIGGGVKIKLHTLIEEGIPFISTPFGFEGYPKELIDHKFCIVAECDKWADTIIKILK